MAFLQVAAEWGLPVLALLTGTVALWLYRAARWVRRIDGQARPEAAIGVCLFLSLFGALLHAQVDGVLVIPYTQTWLAICGGWYLGVWAPATTAGTASRVGQAGGMAGLAMMAACALVLAAEAWQDVPQLQRMQVEFVERHRAPVQPRFWAHGRIVDSAGWTHLLPAQPTK